MRIKTYMYSPAANTPYLDKTSHKAICPRCGKKTFVNYLNADGIPIADGRCGRCDRRDKCGHHCPPRQYYAEHQSLAESIKIPIKHYPELKKAQPCLLLPQNYMLATLGGYESNRLAVFLHSVFDKYMDTSQTDNLLASYGLGTAGHGEAIYWQVDQHGRIRTGKVMDYDATTGKRTKGAGSTTWIHTDVKDRYPDCRLEQAFFGSHILRNADQAAAHNNEGRKEMGIKGIFEPVIWLFESEKAALIAALYLKWGGADKTFVPMATGGCEGLNPTPEALSNPKHRLQVLRDRKVVLFPDEGKYSDWSARAVKLRAFCKDISVSTVMERDMHRVSIDCKIECGDGFDDIILRYIASGRIDDIFALL